jgi:hypothetical protein
MSDQLFATLVYLVEPLPFESQHEVTPALVSLNLYLAPLILVSRS